MHTNWLIRNASAILTGLSDDQARHAGPDIRVVDGRIAALGVLEPQAGEAVINARDCVVYPAWVNTHHHLFQSLLKGEPQGLNQTLTPWLAATPYRFRGAFDEESFRLAARIGLVELVRSGCGTVADHHYLYYPGMPFDSAAILFEEAEALGLRFVLCRGGATQTRQLEADLPQALRPERIENYLADVERLVASYHDPAADAWRRVVMAPTTTLHSTTPEELRLIADVARSLGIRLHSHLSETVDYLDAARTKFGMTPVQFCAEQGWVGSDVWFAHLVKLLPEEIRLLGETGTGIASCPQSNGRLGSGIADLPALEAAGVAVSLGVDGAASNEAADMQSEAHAAWLLQRARKGEQAQPRYDGGPSKAVPMPPASRTCCAGELRAVPRFWGWTPSVRCRSARLRTWPSTVSTIHAISDCTIRPSGRSPAAVAPICRRCWSVGDGWSKTMSFRASIRLNWDAARAKP